MIVDSDSSLEGENNGIIPKEMVEVAENLTMNLLPQKSRQNYTAAYNAFKKWRREMKSNSFDEIVLLNYFDMLSNKYAPNSLWATYSKLKMTINCYDHIHISNYKKLQTYLKRKSAGYQPKKSAVFTKENIVRFLNDAPDEIYLATKVALIMGIAGALRRGEFVNLLISDCLQGEDVILVNVKLTKNKVPRSFTVMGELYDICKKYMNARPERCPTDRFFLKYAKDKCICQPIGINTFGAMPLQIASFLNLPHASTFTGHSFRRTSATLLVDAGADITALKRHGGWKSNTVAEGYIAESLNNKKKVFKQIISGISINNVADTENMDPNIEKARIDPSNADNEVQPYSRQPSTSAAQPKVQSTATKTSTSSAHQKVEPVCKKKKNRNLPAVHDSTAETSSTSEIEISNSNILLAGDSILESTTSTIDEKDPKLPVFYDPDIGLFLHDMINGNPNKTIILNNCNVTLHGELNNNIVFKNCSFKKSEDSEG